MRSVIVVTLVLAAFGLTSLGSTAVEDASARKPCIAVAQGINRLHNISCGQAKRVYWKIRRLSAVSLPECRGDAPLNVGGWRITAKPIGPTGIGIGTKFTRKRKSFVASGGGTCF